MSLTEVVVQGTLNPDGTLNLDEKPSLSPGRVTVVLRQESQPPAAANLFQFMQTARQKMVAAGCQFMDEKEVEVHIEWLRKRERIDDMLREGKEHQLKSEQP